MSHPITMARRSGRFAPSKASTGQVLAQPKIWIDLDNTPHVPFFRPIIRELRERNISVVVTARDAFQVCELAARLGVGHRQIGRHSGKSGWRKLAGLVIRAVQLAPVAIKERPTLALSHGARSQILAANLTGIPTVMIDDYEHSRHVPFARPKWAILPEVLAGSVDYCSKARIRSYPGIKEDVYVGDFLPAPSFGKALGLNSGDLVVTIRPPATIAHYHNPESEHLLEHLMERLCSHQNVKAIVLPRNRTQEMELRQKYPGWFASGKIVIPDSVVDGLDLVWASDLVVSGGGTMNREAAALGVPVYSIFCGPTGLVDRWLEQQGRLVFIRNRDDVYQKIRLSPRVRSQYLQASRPALGTILAELEQILSDEAAA